MRNVTPAPAPDDPPGAFRHPHSQSSNMRHLIAICLIMCVGAASAPALAGHAKNQVVECAKAGGFMERRGMQNNKVCVVRYRDANKLCSDKSDCEGDCLIDLGREDHTEAELAQAVKGRCQADDQLLGCYAEIAKGKVVSRICAD